MISKVKSYLMSKHLSIYREEIIYSNERNRYFLLLCASKDEHNIRQLIQYSDTLKKGSKTSTAYYNI